MVPRWKVEFFERKKKYEERKAVGGAAGKDEDKEEDSNDDDVSRGKGCVLSPHSSAVRAQGLRRDAHFSSPAGSCRTHICGVTVWCELELKSTCFVSFFSLAGRGERKH